MRSEACIKMTEYISTFAAREKVNAVKLSIKYS